MLMDLPVPTRLITDFAWDNYPILIGIQPLKILVDILVKVSTGCPNKFGKPTKMVSSEASIVYEKMYFVPKRGNLVILVM